MKMRDSPRKYHQNAQAGRLICFPRPDKIRILCWLHSSAADNSEGFPRYPEKESEKLRDKETERQIPQGLRFRAQSLQLLQAAAEP